MSFSKSYLFILLILFVSLGKNFTQIRYADNDPRWNRLVTAVYPSGQYVQLPQKMLKVAHIAPRVIRTPYEVLLVNPSIQVLPSAGTSQTEVPLVACRTNPNLMFGSSNAVSGSTINSGSYITTNGGVSWFGSNMINNGNTSNQRGDPGPTYDKNQRVIFTHLSSASTFGSVTGMAAEYSTDFGQTFSASVQVEALGSATDKNLAGTDDNPGSPFYGNSYFAWTLLSGTNSGHFARTTNGGVNWSTPLIINSTPAGYFAQGHDVDTRPNGDVIVCWALEGSSVNSKFYGVAKSTNGGVSFGMVLEQAYAANGTRSGSFNGWSIRTNDFPRMSIDKSGGARNGWIYIVSDEFNLAPAGSDADVIMHRSTDGGATWSAGIRVNQDPLNNGKVQFFPCVNVDAAGGVNVAYYDNRNFPSVGDSATVFISRSLDGGNTWTDIEVPDHHFRPKPTPGLSGGYMGDYIGVTSGNGKVWAFWTDDKAGTFNAWAGYITTSISQPAHDIAVGPFLSLPPSFTVNQSYPIRTKVQNVGTSNETGVPIRFYINGTLTNTTNINLTANQVDSVNNNWTPAAVGIYNLKYISALSTDTIRTNDTVQTTVTVLAGSQTNCQGFTSLTFPPTGWTTVFTGTDYWSLAAVSGFCVATGSAEYDFYDDPPGDQQQLITATFSPTGMNGDSLVFQNAYATYATEDDQLQILTSTNGGTTWTSLITLDGGVSGPLVTAPPTTSPFVPTCTQWKYQRLVLPAQVNMIQFNAISAFGNNLYLDSICIITATGIIPIANINKPSVYSINQNYPNPFNPTTRIQYGIPKAGLVKLVVYDVLGAEVATLVNEFKQAGYHSVSFNAGSLASGVYFYRIESGDFTAVKKMVLIK